ncbi:MULTISPECIES: helix-turn-helix domain-containing protein [Chryseobacterium]|uniref:Helix-turn-helix domain-containing protein n=3 Tax=Chryseobacterium TaxID=59732 RepID=A0A1N7QJH1_9FLAO|nr:MULTISPECIES: helix-turn-helix domain-containing protein [Chryseobacterium]MEC3874919.1 helix-turn-helix domain-containing protein [Chryseobacterium sp. T9W2-O]SIT22657.1 Helix-turn-helix domain-containing protein [Chryseobacterium gambrini]
MSLIQGQNLNEQSYKNISGLFNSYSENDERALVFVNLYISKAKKDHNYKKLIRGYEEAIYYSRDVNRKLLYADSTIITAIQNKNDDDISRAYLGKGIIYYYNRRQYKPALEQYLIAFKFSKNSKDDYLKNKITYHLGMVKSYLGYYKEAAVHFEEAADYFEKKSKENVHPNIRLNNESGYFNSIYRLSTCYRNLRLYQKEDSLINIGLRRLHNTAQLSTEYGYFQKGKGVQLLRLGNTDDALQYFKQSKDILSHHQDDASLMTVYFYMGKAYWSDRKRAESLQYLNKVDSLVNKFWFVTPEIRSGYEYLIKDAKQNKNYERQLYYTNQLLKADSIINADFAMLSSKIHREYDTNTLLEEKNKLQRVHKNGFIILYYSMGFGLMILCFSIWKFRKREKALTIKYQELLEKFNTSQPTDHFLESKPVSSEEKNIYSAEIIEEVKANLKIFEERKNFLKQNLTLPIVAKMIGSNRTHLSYVLNVHLDVTFTTYLKILRIRYITNLLLEDSKYLKFKIDSLAEKCGMANRQIFSAHFLEINGIRPTDFIRKRLDEIQKN